MNGDGPPVSGEGVADSTDNPAMLSESPVEGRVADVPLVGV